LKNQRSLDTIVELKRVQKQVTYFYIQSLHVPAERKRATAVLNTGRVPANCRIPLRYIQQFAGTHTKPSSRKLYEFYEVCLSGDQHRRYAHKVFKF